MKRFFLFAIATSVALSTSAQLAKSSLTSVSPVRTLTNGGFIPSAKTTAIGDIDTSGHIFSTDTLAVYYAGITGVDSGYLTGINAYGTKGYAERFSFSGGDSSVSVLGLLTQFTGTVNPATTKTVSFNAWSVAAKSTASGAVSGHLFNSGLPGTSLAALSVPLTQLGISTTGGGDTIKAFMFPSPTAYVPRFFIGYTINYSPTAFGGDTIAVLSNLDGERHYTYGYTSGADTIINNVNATMYADGTWHDNAREAFGQFVDFAFYPIFKIGAAIVNVNGITKNDLTIFGNYPNPAVNATNIKFAVAKPTDVTISITDMSGKVVASTSQKFNSGTQVVEMNTSSLPTGEYIYLVRTAEGDGMAAKMTIIK